MPFVLAILAAFILALPAQWCQALPGAPFECCPACADDERDEGSGEDGHEVQCECGTIPFKQPDLVATLPTPTAVLTVATPDYIGAPTAADAPIALRNLQQLLCRWLK